MVVRGCSCGYCRREGRGRAEQSISRGYSDEPQWTHPPIRRCFGRLPGEIILTAYIPSVELRASDKTKREAMTLSAELGVSDKERLEAISHAHRETIRMVTVRGRKQPTPMAGRNTAYARGLFRISHQGEYHKHAVRTHMHSQYVILGRSVPKRSNDPRNEVTNKRSVLW